MFRINIIIIIIGGGGGGGSSSSSKLRLSENRLVRRLEAAEDCITRIFINFIVYQILLGSSNRELCDWRSM
jgi:hypothetical protein